jgi:hypothetical protein
MRNVQISRYPVSLTGQAVKTVSVYGDSIVALASYDNGYIDHPPTIDDPDNNPQNTGYVSPDYVLGQGQAASTNWYKNRSLLDIMHKGLALKGIYPTAQHINGFGRSGSRLVDWDSRGDNLFDDRIDAALGIGTEYPTTTLPDDVSDIAFISEGTNDAVYFMLHGGTPSDFEDQLITAAKAGMDRLIDEAGVKHIVYFSPIRVFIFTYPLESYPEITERAYNAIMRLDGYRGVCRVVDVYTGWTTSYTTDALHPNPTGMEYMIAQAADAIPNFLLSGAQTFTYPLERHPDDDLVILNTDPSSGAAFNGYWSAANWVNKPANDRCYRMREGSGDEFYDSYDRSESQVNRAEIQGTTPEEQWS